MFYTVKKIADQNRIKLGLGDVSHGGPIGARPHGPLDFIGLRGV
jgi:hypothetical protein